MMTRKSSNGSSTTTVTVTPCCSKVGIKRGPWTAEEDEVLAAFVRKEGEGRWRTLPKRAGLARCGKSCRLRWMNYLRPSVKRGHIAADEEDLILRLHRLLGNRWSLIAGRIPGRTDNEIKNYWNTHLSKKLISQGIDPRTHKPFKPNSDDNNNNNNSSSSCKTDDEDRRRPCNPNNSNKKMKIKRSHDDHEKTAVIIQENIASTTTSENNNNNINIIVDHDMNHYHDQAINNFENDISNNIDQVVSSDQEADDLNYCTDDVFSSFLNSLINEDAFAPIVDPFLSVNSGSDGWESAIVSSSSSSVPLNQINNNQG